MQLAQSTNAILYTAHFETRHIAGSATDAVIGHLSLYIILPTAYAL
jgi:hypothetical protein